MRLPILEEPPFGLVGREAEMTVCAGSHRSAAGGPLQQSDLQQIRFVDVLKGAAILSDRRGERLQANRSAIVDIGAFRPTGPPS